MPNIFDQVSKREPKQRIQPYIGGGGQVSSSSSSSLTVKEVDGSPSVSSVSTIRFPNGSVTDDGSGQVTITFTASIDGSGAATRLAIWSDADTLTSDAGLTYLTASDILTVSGGNPFVNVTDGGSPATITSVSAGDIGIQKNSTTLSPAVTFTRIRNTLDYPNSADNLGIIDFRSSDGATPITPARIVVAATENHTASAGGVSFSIETAPNGSTTRAARIFIDSAGLVGIGLSVPLTLLHLNGSGDVELSIQSTTGSKRFTLQTGATGTFQIIDRTAGTARLAVTSTGLVGVGAATAPTTGQFNIQPTATNLFGLGISSANGHTVDLVNYNQTSVGTAVVLNMLTANMNSTSTPAAGFGGKWTFGLESSSTNDQVAVAWVWEWSVATHGSRTAAAVVQVVNNAAALVEVARFGGFSGGVAALTLRAIASGNEGLRVLSNDGTVIIQVTSDGSEAFIGTTTDDLVNLISNGSANIRYTDDTIGFYGVTPVARQTAAAVSTDLATVITLANQIRQDLIDLGLFQA